ncbi:unnamed protein product [Rotaria sp. Silwood1]|nr:unnamed protein product [Rotaria sp. Silwood1]
MESNGTSLKMTPAWFKLNDQQAVLKDIVYPPAINDNQPFDTIAAYRTFTNKSKDFCRKPINIAEDSTETLILVLDAFARKFNGNLTITMNDVPVDDSSHCLACGIGNLGNVHMLTNNYVPMAKDYEKSEILESEMRGGYPYYRPIGWYRHALKIDHKHLDDATWLSCDNADDEWPVAFQGTHQNTINNGSLQFDGIEMNEPRLYLATHCNGGSHPRFTEVFSVKVSNKNTENYRLVFQCRVQPKMFTVHESSIEKGEMWRFVDPKAIRPYGLLLKKEEES